MNETVQPVQPRMQSAPINLFAKASESGGQVVWSLGTHNPPAPGKASVDIPKGDPGREIVIHLVSTQGLDVTFDRKDPIWATETRQCPPPQPKIDTDQLGVVDCTDRKLTLFDSNSRECVITYQLNFHGAPAFDPEIRNGGRV